MHFMQGKYDLDALFGKTEKEKKKGENDIRKKIGRSIRGEDKGIFREEKSATIINRSK